MENQLTFAFLRELHDAVERLNKQGGPGIATTGMGEEQNAVVASTQNNVSSQLVDRSFGPQPRKNLRYILYSRLLYIFAFHTA